MVYHHYYEIYEITISMFHGISSYILIYPACSQPYQFVFLHSESTLHWPQLESLGIGHNWIPRGSALRSTPPWRTAGDPGPGRWGRWVARWPGGHG